MYIQGVYTAIYVDMPIEGHVGEQVDRYYAIDII